MNTVEELREELELYDVCGVKSYTFLRDALWVFSLRLAARKAKPRGSK